MVNLPKRGTSEVPRSAAPPPCGRRLTDRNRRNRSLKGVRRREGSGIRATGHLPTAPGADKGAQVAQPWVLSRLQSSDTRIGLRFAVECRTWPQTPKNRAARGVGGFRRWSSCSASGLCTELLGRPILEPSQLPVRPSTSDLLTAPHRAPPFSIGRSKGPLEFARDHTCLCPLSRKRLQGPHIFLRPRPQLRSLRRHFCSPCTNVANESAATAKKARFPLLPKWSGRCALKSQTPPVFHIRVVPSPTSDTEH
jgi:hypothetical protein